MQFVNAGHLPPLVRRADGRFERVSGSTGSGLALGMFEGATYATNAVTIGSGDVLVMYTDGITEAENPAGRAFEDAGLESVLAENWEKDAEQLGVSILKAVEHYAADVRLADDLTALVLKRSTNTQAA